MTEESLFNAWEQAVAYCAQVKAELDKAWDKVHELTPLSHRCADELDKAWSEVSRLQHAHREAHRTAHDLEMVFDNFCNSTCLIACTL